MAVFRGHSSYYYQLPEAAAHIYDEKIYVIGNVDPYIIEKDNFHADVATWPSVLHGYSGKSCVHNKFRNTRRDEGEEGPPVLQKFIDGM